MSAAPRQFMPHAGGSLFPLQPRIAGPAGSAVREKNLPGRCGRIFPGAAFA
jgi:hypothetical protein